MNRENRAKTFERIFLLRKWRPKNKNSVFRLTFGGRFVGRKVAAWIFFLFVTSWESQPGTVTDLIICRKAADFMLDWTNREMALDDHFINQGSKQKLVWKWITFHANYFLQFFFRRLICIKKKYKKFKEELLTIFAISTRADKEFRAGPMEPKYKRNKVFA